MKQVQKYRKRPVIIEAALWTGNNFEEMGLLIGDKKFEDNECFNYTDKSPDGPHEIEIGTLEGKMIAHPGDYVIKGVKGELYPCKADIFEMTYELVDPDLEEFVSNSIDEPTLQQRIDTFNERAQLRRDCKEKVDKGIHGMEYQKQINAFNDRAQAERDRQKVGKK